MVLVVLRKKKDMQNWCFLVIGPQDHLNIKYNIRIFKNIEIIYIPRAIFFLSLQKNLFIIVVILNLFML
jgi:hypothetical protein